MPLFDEDELKQAPIERAETIPSHWYTSEEVLSFEKEHLFSSFWQLACHGCQHHGWKYLLDGPL